MEKGCSEEPPALPARSNQHEWTNRELDVADKRGRGTERTTIVRTDPEGRGTAGIILLVALVVIILAVLFFAGVFSRSDDRELNVAVNAPDVNLVVPETQTPVVAVPVPESQVPPDVNVNVTTPPAEPLPEENLSTSNNTLTNTQ
jgi:hypothetical protein